MNYEKDLKQNKFLSRENSLILRLNHTDWPFTLKLESTKRKNFFDYYASKELLHDELLPTTKNSVALEMNDMNEKYYLRSELELSLPDTPFLSSDLSSFLKLDTMIASNKKFYDDKIKVCSSFSFGGMVSSGKTSINDRFFV